MRQIQALFHRIATRAAIRLLAWVEKHVDPAQQLWLDALRAELDAINGGFARLLWAAGGLRLVWFERRRHMLNATYRYGPVLLPWIETALFIGLTWSFIQHYGSLVVVLFELIGLGLILAIPALLALVRIIQSLAAMGRGAPHAPELRTRPPFSFVLSVLSLATLLGLWLSAPLALNQLLYQQGAPTAGVVVSSVDHRTAEAILNQTDCLSHAEDYLTTQVKPLTVNGMALDQLPQLDGPKSQTQEPQALIGIQGYDLTHGQLPDGAGMGFGSDWGSNGPGPDQILGPPGRLLGTHDANTLNVLIPVNANGLGERIYNNSTVTVQNPITGQTLSLHVVGQYVPAGTSTTPLFGKFLVDDSVVQTLSGGHPSYAYGLRLDENQVQTTFGRLQSNVPTARLYDFMSDPIGPSPKPEYALFTRPYPADLSGYIDSNLRLPISLAALWALLFAAIIVLNWETRRLIKRYGLWREKARRAL